MGVKLLALGCLLVLGCLHSALARDVAQSHDFEFPGAYCMVPFNALPYPEQPLILIPGTEKFWYPADETRVVHFPPNASVELACLDGFWLFPETNIITVKCDADTQFWYDGKQYEMAVLACNSRWLSSARNTQERCLQGAGEIVQIGFPLSTDRWVNVFDVCYEEKLYHTHFVRHRMTRANGGYQSGNPRPAWYQGPYYTEVDINNLYTVNRQRETIAIILGSQDRADELVQSTNNGIYMARGHIAARADFIYGTEQNATFWFLNAAPQWQNFNGVNWERVESSIRDFVGSRDLELTVYSGTYGVQKLADGNGDYQEIWLDYGPTEGTRRAPAPMLYYKILHDERNNAGIAIVGVNNVHVPLDIILKEYVLCRDIGDEVDWIDWQRKNLTIGYCYACEVNEFNAAIGKPHPQLDVARLLTSGAGERLVVSFGALLVLVGHLALRAFTPA
ncbi:AGAP011048-PA-like protein [Anopheles sinensis]|uniref:AGAP011048-PA-like protein n=1 Tax=Anopheles sinensis TaxID=74873 RepID=A0A084WAC9_ANOSI|nr:AGAP011048-PA-like protein [Anopheles sinensis]